MESTFFNPQTAACQLAAAVYPQCPPFHPSAEYPEYRLRELGPANEVYAGVRELFRLLGMDAAHYGSPSWNPLGEIVKPGDKVVLKPNLIWHAHRYRPDEFEQVITHGSIVRAVLDYVLIALQGRGEICVADGPQLDADWNLIMARTGLGQLCAWYSARTEIPIRLLDLRDTWEDVRGEVLYGTTPLPGDPAGSVEINLGARSRLADHHGAGRYYGATYDQAETNFHHSGGRHEYRLSRTVAAADVLINLPKMKTHKKTGVTLCLKNLVGINTGRNWLPHHTDGAPGDGGDQFPVATAKNTSERKGIRFLENLTMVHPALGAPIYRLAKTVARPIWGHTRETIRSGNWHGNDTAWRMVQDINRALFFSDGSTFPTPRPKRFFAVVDGVVAGDSDGPAAPDRKETALLVAGFNPVAVDCVAVRLMGFDPMKLAVLRESFAPSDLPLAPFAYEEIQVASHRPEWQGRLRDLADEHTFHFQPHFGWRRQIEWSGPAALAAA
ncbi:MAG: DUF362 domain-containing protein [Verrucomicrobia bacterium]|nr:DUF362 domain-containing protein [Verrucomicrobiota bacterium]